MSQNSNAEETVLLRIWEDAYSGGKWVYVERPVSQVAPGTTIWRGQFRRVVDSVSVQSGQKVTWEPTGEIYSEPFGSGPGQDTRRF